MADPILSVENLNKSFGSLKATDSLSFSVTRGCVHALIGPNGAGKTTAIGQLIGEIKPDGGSIVFDGQDISRLPTFARARLGLQRSYQVTSLFPDFTAEQNVTTAGLAGDAHCFRFWSPVGKDKQIKEKAVSALSLVGLENRADTPAKNLAHGEQRQLELAMALVNQPKLLLLDEPMAGMGQSEGKRLMETLASLKGQVSILLVEHDMDIVFSLADTVSVLVKGQVLSSGSPDTIRKDPDVRRAYLGDESLEKRD